MVLTVSIDAAELAAPWAPVRLPCANALLSTAISYSSVAVCKAFNRLVRSADEPPPTPRPVELEVGVMLVLRM